MKVTVLNNDCKPHLTRLPDNGFHDGFHQAVQNETSLTHTGFQVDGGIDGGRSQTAANAAPATAGANQGGRKGITRSILKPGDDSPQRRGIYAQLCVRFPERAAWKVGFQFDSESRAREAAGESAAGG